MILSQKAISAARTICTGASHSCSLVTETSQHMLVKKSQIWYALAGVPCPFLPLFSLKAMVDNISVESFRYSSVCSNDETLSKIPEGWYAESCQFRHG